MFQAQVNTIKYAGMGGHGGGGYQQPNTLMANQKNVLAGFVQEDDLIQDGEANRKIDMNELKSLLA